MRINIKLLLIIIFMLLILAYIGINIGNIPSFSNMINNSSNKLEPNDDNKFNENSSPISDFNDSLSIPPNDYIINSINWTSYPNLQTGYVHLAQVCEPNDIVPHKYIAIGIISEVKDGNNKTLVYEQLGGVAREVRHLSGPNSAIVIFGTDHGVVAWTVTMGVYDDKIYY